MLVDSLAFACFVSNVASFYVQLSFYFSLTQKIFSPFLKFIANDISRIWSQNWKLLLRFIYKYVDENGDVVEGKIDIALYLHISGRFV